MALLALAAMALSMASFIAYIVPRATTHWFSFGYSGGIVLGAVGIALTMMARRGRRSAPPVGQRFISAVSVLTCFFAVPYIFAWLLLYLHLTGGLSMGH